MHIDMMGIKLKYQPIRRVEIVLQIVTHHLPSIYPIHSRYYEQSSPRASRYKAILLHLNSSNFISYDPD